MTYKLRKIVASGIVIGVVVGAAVGGLGGAATGASASTGGRLVLEIETVGAAQSVSQCVGLGDTSAIVEQLSQGGTSYSPGTTTPLQLVCTRGYDPGQDAFVNWREAVLVGHSSLKRDLSVVLVDGTSELDRWNYYGAWPFALEVIPSLDGGMREVVSIQADGMDRP